MAPAIPVRSMGQQGLKASAQGLGETSPAGLCKLRTTFDVRVSNLAVSQAAWECQWPTKIYLALLLTRKA